ncbi:HDIG domain protein [Coriobacteriaceae bacterium BV3Ac1]|uniref:CCA tRNA nucleotidyltransferase n=1 Tax=Olegusella massiliensis TaxID=1776381 RepID=UPI0003ADD47D|nr:HD domain-containing protein [Olegusella massiliensis]ERL12534.1 HDIG domain protein [Coriobacteriaceae bacterium BV3Ac1]
MPLATSDISLELPRPALRVVEVLESAGFEAWAVGGWVRDALLARTSHDVDVTTSASWQESKQVLLTAGMAVHETGTAHGTITAVCDFMPIEVTTYRVEGSYSDHRHPDEVRFVRNVCDDLGRRDFTINAMAYHPTRGLLDPYGGQVDLERGLIRAVGVAKERFEEDALRVLRAVRFACRFGFEVEEETHTALVACAPQLAHVAQERIGQEMRGIVESGHVDWALMHQTDVMVQAIPELAAMVGFDQCSPYHAFDVLEHTARVCRAVEEFEGGVVAPELRWAALLHDIAKPATFSKDDTGRGHFFGHPKLGAEMAENIMRRMALPSELVNATRMLVRMHDHVVVPTTRSIRRTLRKFELACPGRAVALTWQLIDLKRSDAVAKVPRAANYAIELDVIAHALRREVAAVPPLKVQQLAISGADVIAEMQLEPGPAVGLVLDTLLAAVINDEIPNEREVLLAQIRGY